MSTIQEILGTDPIYHPEGDYYTPSALTSKALPGKSGYIKENYASTYQGDDNKILVICTDDHFVTCSNGKRFKSGNQPVETLVVLMQLEDAGFEPIFATLSGNSVKFEEFGMPDEEDIRLFRAKYQPQLFKPRVLADVLEELPNEKYKAVYLPGGHGAILGNPESSITKKALQYFIENDKHLITICHGPAALLSLMIDENLDSFPLKGYTISCFPDIADQLAVASGYLPGPMPFVFSTLLEGYGMKVLSYPPIGITHKDRNLISGDTPMAANRLGVLASKTLLGISDK